MNTRLILSAALLLFIANGLGAAEEEWEIRALFRRALAGEAGAVEQCIGKLETAVNREPQNQFARVYLGSAYTLRSRDLGYGPAKLRALRQGLTLMDQAVSAAPADAKVRLARALTTSALPSIFGRGAETRRDFLLLAEMAPRAQGQFAPGDLQLVYYRGGLAARTLGDDAKAIALWQEGMRHPTDADLAQKIERELAATK